MTSVTQRVYVDGPIHEEALGMLRRTTEVVPAAVEIGEALPDVHAVLLRTASLYAEAIERARSLRVIARHGVGVDNVAVDVAARRGIPVLITPQANLRSVAEHVFALALAVSRNLILADDTVRSGRFASRDRLIGRELFGATLGVIGLGKLGRRVARVARAFEMDVLAWSHNLDPGEARRHGAEPVGRDELLSRADVVTIHLRLSDRTRGLIGAAELARMKRSAVLVNTSRGPIVDEAALVAALRDGVIAGAGLDVYDTEPLPAGHPIRSAPNTVLTPHLGYVTSGTYARYYEDAVEAIAAFARSAPVRVLNA